MPPRGRESKTPVMKGRAKSSPSVVKGRPKSSPASVVKSRPSATTKASKAAGTTPSARNKRSTTADGGAGKKRPTQVAEGVEKRAEEVDTPSMKAATPSPKKAATPSLKKAATPSLKKAATPSMKVATPKKTVTPMKHATPMKSGKSPTPGRKLATPLRAKRKAEEKQSARSSSKKDAQKHSKAVKKDVDTTSSKAAQQSLPPLESNILSDGDGRSQVKASPAEKRIEKMLSEINFVSPEAKRRKKGGDSGPSSALKGKFATPEAVRRPQLVNRDAQVRLGHGIYLAKSAASLRSRPSSRRNNAPENGVAALLSSNKAASSTTTVVNRGRNSRKPTTSNATTTTTTTTTIEHHACHVDLGLSEQRRLLGEVVEDSNIKGGTTSSSWLRRAGGPRVNFVDILAPETLLGPSCDVSKGFGASSSAASSSSSFVAPLANIDGQGSRRGEAEDEAGRLADAEDIAATKNLFAARKEESGDRLQEEGGSSMTKTTARQGGQGNESKKVDETFSRPVVEKIKDADEAVLERVTDSDNIVDVLSDSASLDSVSAIDRYVWCRVRALLEDEACTEAALQEKHVALWTSTFSKAYGGLLNKDATQAVEARTQAAEARTFSRFILEFPQIVRAKTFSSHATWDNPKLRKRLGPDSRLATAHAIAVAQVCRERIRRHDLPVEVEAAMSSGRRGVCLVEQREVWTVYAAEEERNAAGLCSTTNNKMIPTPDSSCSLSEQDRGRDRGKDVLGASEVDLVLGDSNPFASEEGDKAPIRPVKSAFDRNLVAGDKDLPPTRAVLRDTPERTSGVGATKMGKKKRKLNPTPPIFKTDFESTECVFKWGEWDVEKILKQVHGLFAKIRHFSDRDTIGDGSTSTANRSSYDMNSAAATSLAARGSVDAAFRPTAAAFRHELSGFADPFVQKISTADMFAKAGKLVDLAHVIKRILLDPLLLGASASADRIRSALALRVDRLFFRNEMISAQLDFASILILLESLAEHSPLPRFDAVAFLLPHIQEHVGMARRQPRELGAIIALFARSGHSLTRYKKVVAWLENLQDDLEEEYLDIIFPEVDDFEDEGVAAVAESDEVVVHQRDEVAHQVRESSVKASPASASSSSGRGLDCSLANDLPRSSASTVGEIGLLTDDEARGRGKQIFAKKVVEDHGPVEGASGRMKKMTMSTTKNKINMLNTARKSPKTPIVDPTYLNLVARSMRKRSSHRRTGGQEHDNTSSNGRQAASGGAALCPGGRSSANNPAQGGPQLGGEETSDIKRVLLPSLEESEQEKPTAAEINQTKKSGAPEIDFDEL
ncbi:unnamed protein product [Amoebophrya sp. A25]|nr:unnamed protein product [Amoebophrya sp. A25]|eukprot:GSA25T00009075001.1